MPPRKSPDRIALEEATKELRRAIIYAAEKEISPIAMRPALKSIVQRARPIANRVRLSEGPSTFAEIEERQCQKGVKKFVDWERSKQKAGEACTTTGEAMFREYYRRLDKIFRPTGY